MASTEEYKDFDSESKMFIQSLIKDIVSMAIIRATIIPGENYMDFQTDYEEKRKKLIDKYLKKKEEEIEVEEIKNDLEKYYKKHKTVNVPRGRKSKGALRKLGSIVCNIRSTHSYIIKNPKFFYWLLDRGFCMSFSHRKKDEKRHKEAVDKVKEEHAKILSKEKNCRFFYNEPELKKEIDDLNVVCIAEYEDYKAKCAIAGAKNEHLIYGKPYPRETNDYGDARLIYFNTKSNNLKSFGEEVKLSYIEPQWIQPDGGIYKLLRNGKKSKVCYGNSNLQFKLGLECLDSRVKINIYLLVLFSYFPHLNWKKFCQNIERKKNGNMLDVDHILQKKEICHFAYLECIPHSENLYRMNYYKNFSKDARTIISSKPFKIFNNDKPIYNAINTNDGANFLKENYGFKQKMLACRISRALNNKSDRHETEQKFFKKFGITFKYVENFIESQKDLDGEIWYFNPNNEHDSEVLLWMQAEDPYLKDSSLKAISNKGRIWDGNNHKRYGNINKKEVVIIIEEAILANAEPPSKIHSNCDGNKLIHKLVWLACKKEKIPAGKLILHKNGDEYLRQNEYGQRINVYSNDIDSLYIGSDKKNAIDRVEDMISWYKRIPSREFRIYNSEGQFQGTYHSVMEFLKDVGEESKTKKWGGLFAVLKGTKIHCLGYTIDYVIPRPNMPVHIRPGKKMMDIKTNKPCFIKKLAKRIYIEFCDNQVKASRTNTIQQPAFKDIEE